MIRPMKSHQSHLKRSNVTHQNWSEMEKKINKIQNWVENLHICKISVLLISNTVKYVVIFRDDSG